MPEDGDRLSIGRSESSELLDDCGGGGGGEERRGDTVAELSGVIVAPVALSALETARRILGRSGSSSTLCGIDELDELLEELLATSPELEGARRSLGRSGSSSRLDELLEELLDELPVELLTLSSELPDARRNLGRFGLLSFEESDEFEAVAVLADEPLPEPFVIGRDVSSTACEAAACSSIVPSRNNSIFEARYVLFFSCFTLSVT